ncbi:MAG: hypothetical protein HY922_07530 [Elusimicrobia bacterium]|nr:hypothetical protein [Elusimicrobiota bacterium]
MSSGERPARRLLLAALVAGGCAAGFLVLELAARIWERRLHGTPVMSVENYLQREFRMENTCATDWDPDLGWAPVTAKSGLPNIYGTTVRILEQGIRSNGPGEKPLDSSEPRLLAVGDSLTFADQLSDWESWPSALERKIPYKVMNAGVCAYGIDQSYIRASQLLPAFKPKVMVLSFAVSGIVRSEWTTYPEIHDAPKPYFEVHGGQPLLRNSPSPRVDRGLDLDFLHSALGLSALSHRLFGRYLKSFWYTHLARLPAQTSGQNGEAVACALMGGLKRMGKESGARVILLLQYWPRTLPGERGRMLAVKGCAQRAGLEVLDLYGPLESVRLADPKRYDGFFNRHMSASGNAFVADLLAERILRPRP